MFITYGLPNKPSLTSINPIKVPNNLISRTIINETRKRKNCKKMAKDILKEAIADAKAVREVALANAKAALEEAFTPKLQSMLSAKLSEDLDEDFYEDEDKELDLGEAMHDEDMDEDMDEMHGMHDEDMDEDMDEMHGMHDEDMDEDMYEGEEDSIDEEIDLEEILNELEMEGDVEEELIDEEEDVDLEEVLKPHYEAGDVQIVNPSADPNNLGYIHEDKEFDLDSLLKEINDLEEKEETTEGTQMNESVFAAIGGLVGLIGAAGVISQIEMALEDPAISEKYPKLAKVFEFLQKIGGSVGKGIKEDDITEEKEDKEKKEADSKELEETKAALEAVKAELNEVNLLNSKLLYVNRIFKANNLDEGQKLRVVETLDNAESAKEAKLIYETIKDSFRIAKSEKVRKKAKTLKEGFKGMASKAAGTSTAPKKPVLNESNDMMKRFQKLANIKISQ